MKQPERWRVSASGDGIETESGEPIIFSGYEETRPKIEHLRRIVRCVNGHEALKEALEVYATKYGREAIAHDELLEAVEEFVEFYAKGNNRALLGNGQSLQTWVKLRAILEKAEKQL